MRASLFILLLVLAACSDGWSQDCPKWLPNEPSLDSVPRKLTGKVVFHNDLRQWLSLELNEPVCGTRRIQLVEFDEGNSHSFEVFRGCRVTVTGKLGIPGTGYFSAELYQEVTEIQPVAGCVRQPAFPDYSKVKPDPNVRRYQVKIWFDYFGPQGPLHVSASSGNEQLRPWQAYASTSFNGGFGLTAGCTDGFSMRLLPEARPWISDDQVLLDPEWAAEKHVRRIQLSYICSR